MLCRLKSSNSINYMATVTTPARLDSHLQLKKRGVHVYTKNVVPFRTYAMAALFLTVIGTPVQASTEPKEISVDELKTLAPELSRGGYVFYVRHASTRKDQEDQKLVDFKDCNTQRNLSDQGKEEALRLGQGMRKLKIPVGKVVSSPYCRARDTAKLAFGKTQVADALYISAKAPEDEIAKKTAALRKMVATPPARG